MTEETCETCRFYIAIRNDLDYGTDYGECVRYAPHPKHPTVVSGHWCGDYERAEDAPTQQAPG